MKIQNYRLILAFIFILGSQVIVSAQSDYVQVSIDFLRNIRNNEDTKDQEILLQNATVEELANDLETNTDRLVFWINVYNGFIQKILMENPELYEDRGEFFKNKQIPIIGRTLSFTDIEHGMIRRSQFEYFLGYVTNWFAPSYEKKLRVFEQDAMIHFALNCGAKDCPYIVIYTPNRYEYQISESTREYLNKISVVEEEWKKVKTTPLMSWFRGDFGGKKGSKEMLADYGVIPSAEGWEIAYLGYDWTLELGNFTDY